MSSNPCGRSNAQKLTTQYRRPDGTEIFQHIYVVEWDKNKWADNDFCIVNPLTIRGANDRRPDIIIYLNGFPIVLFELKNLKVDWTKTHREDVKAGVRAAVKTVLRKRGVEKELLDT